VFSSAKAIAAVSRALVDYATRVAPSTLAMWIANGVDVDGFATAVPVRLAHQPGSVVIGFVGSMKAWHGVSDLLEAFGSLAPRHPEIRLVVAGSGPEEGALRNQVGHSDLVDRVSFVGSLPHDRVAGLIRGFDIGVAPYRPSADFYFCPLKVLEYLGAGIPTVFPTLGDLPDIVGDTGVGYQPGSVAALTEALARLVVDPGLRQAMAASAGARRADYDWTGTAQRTEALLASCLGASTLGHR
jgi:glycosyltransferase involved in cell wall biosynthesis